MGGQKIEVGSRVLVTLPDGSELPGVVESHEEMMHRQLHRLVLFDQKYDTPHKEWLGKPRYCPVGDIALDPVGPVGLEEELAEAGYELNLDPDTGALRVISSKIRRHLMVLPSAHNAVVLYQVPTNLLSPDNLVPKKRVP